MTTTTPNAVAAQAEVLGSFDLTNTFITAPPNVLVGIGRAITRAGIIPFYPTSLDEVSATLAPENTPDPSAHIVYSFVTKVAQDAARLLSKEPREVPIFLRLPALCANAKPAGDLHEDPLDSALKLNVRYLAANRDPTAIPDLETTAGSIARIAFGHTPHRKPAFSASPQRPRVLLLADV